MTKNLWIRAEHVADYKALHNAVSRVCGEGEVTPPEALGLPKFAPCFPEILVVRLDDYEVAYSLDRTTCEFCVELVRYSKA